MKNRVSYHKAAFSCYRHSFFSSLMLCLSQALLWPALIYGASVAFDHIGLQSLYILFPCALLLLIYRFFVAHQLCKRINPKTPPLKSFFHLIPAAVWRMFIGVLWLIPFGAVIYRFYQYIFVLPATTFTSEFTQMGALIASNSSAAAQLLIGTIMFFSYLIITLVLFLHAWRRGNCFDIVQHATISFGKSLRRARIVRKRSRKARFANTILHTIILLPAIIVPLIPPMLQLHPLLSGKAMNDIQLLYAYLSAGIVSDHTLLLSICLFLVLYLPWLPFRKLHNVAAMVIRHE